jgi:multisubunit Na+/H+ antiporter MnhE subunit
MRGRLLEVVAWWPLLVGIWLLTLSSVNTSDLSFAAGAAVPCAAFATMARRAIAGSWRPDPRWARWIPTLLAAIVTDSVRVFGAAIRGARTRHVPGRFIHVPLPDPGAPRRTAHQALATLTVSATPGSFVVDAEPLAHRLTVHGVTGGRPDLTETVAR